jgi:ligand-binding sensor domain-containing protein
MKSTVLWIVALLLCGGSWSAEADLTLQQLIHKGWTVADGAPGDIRAIAQTTDGTLWLASPSGLSRFDGISFVRYNGPAEQPFESTGIYTITASTDGGLWIGFTWGGISFLKNDTVIHYGEREGLPVGSVRRILTDGNGVTYAATTRGLYRLESNRWASVVVDASDPKPRIYTAVEDRARTFWVSTSAGVYARPVGTTSFREIAKPDMNNFSVPYEIGLAGGPDGAMWATNLSRPGGITRVEAPTDSAQIGLRELASGDTSRANGMFFDREGNLWIGGSKEIHRFAAETLTDDLSSGARRMALFTAADGLTGTVVQCFFEDREGNIWAATTAGLDRFSQSNVIKVVGTSFANPVVIAGEAGTVWASKWSRESSSPLLEIRNNAVVKELPALFVASAYRSPDGSIWFGGWQGLSHFDDGHVTTIALPEKDEVQAMVQDRTGALWVSVIRKGVFRFADGQWSLNGNLPALPRLDAIVETAGASGSLWFGYRSNQIARIDGSSVKLFGTADGLHVGTVMAIAGGRSQHVWIGGELGLARFDGTRFVPVSSASGGSLRGISGIVELKSGDLWLNTSAGIVHLSEFELTHAEHDAQYRVHGEVFDHLDGMPGYAVQVRPTPSAIEGTDGRLWFALTTGLVSIDPLQIKRNPLPPPVTIWSVSAGGTQYPAASQPRLPVHTTNVHIDYTAGSLTIPERVSFRYKLEGSDRDWQYAGNRREVFYTNLGPGPYTFRVIAANNDGVWNMTGASVRFTIAPAFYQTAWFYALCALVSLAFLRFLYMIRIRQLSGQGRSRPGRRLIDR